ncbi:UNVERIFIED_CONTAM: hypothetical protein FKN15_004751 [Acipenser sinensis]
MLVLLNKDAACPNKIRAQEVPQVRFPKKSADWQQDDLLSLAASEEVGEQELALLSEDVESDSTSPAVKLSLSAELLPLIKRASAVLQVPWPTEGETRQSIFDDEPTTSSVSPHTDILRKSADWQQDDLLSLAASEEVGEQELALLSEDVESDSTSPAVKLSLSAELLPLIKRASAVLQVPWPTEGETRQSIFDDEPTTSSVSPHTDILRVHAPYSRSMLSTLLDGRVHRIATCLELFQLNRVLTVVKFHKFLGLMAADSQTLPLGLLRMRLVQALSSWKQPAHLRFDVALGSVTRREVITTNVFSMGWGTVWNGRGAQVLMQLLSCQPWRLPKRRDLLSQAQSPPQSRLSEMQTFIAKACLIFTEARTKVILRTNPAFLPKTISAFHVNQSVELKALHPPVFQSDRERQLHTFCPLRALVYYVDRTKSWRQTERGQVPSKQMLSKWIADTVRTAYERANLSPPRKVHCPFQQGHCNFMGFIPVCICQGHLQCSSVGYFCGKHFAQSFVPPGAGFAASQDRLSCSFILYSGFGFLGGKIPIR